MRHLCQKLLKNRTIVNLGQAHTSISANFPQNTALIKISPKIALFEVLVEPYKNRTISRIALIKWRTNQGFPVYYPNSNYQEFSIRYASRTQIPTKSQTNFSKQLIHWSLGYPGPFPFPILHKADSIHNYVSIERVQSDKIPW